MNTHMYPRTVSMAMTRVNPLMKKDYALDRYHYPSTSTEVVRYNDVFIELYDWLVRNGTYYQVTFYYETIGKIRRDIIYMVTSMNNSSVKFKDKDMILNIMKLMKDIYLVFDDMTQDIQNSFNTKISMYITNFIKYWKTRSTRSGVVTHTDIQVEWTMRMNKISKKYKLYYNDYHYGDKPSTGKTIFLAIAGFLTNRNYLLENSEMKQREFLCLPDAITAKPWAVITDSCCCCDYSRSTKALQKGVYSDGVYSEGVLSKDILPMGVLLKIPRLLPKISSEDLDEID